MVGRASVHTAPRPQTPCRATPCPAPPCYVAACVVLSAARAFQEFQHAITRPSRPRSDANVTEAALSALLADDEAMEGVVGFIGPDCGEVSAREREREGGADWVEEVRWGGGFPRNAS